VFLLIRGVDVDEEIGFASARGRQVLRFQNCHFDVSYALSTSAVALSEGLLDLRSGDGVVEGIDTTTGFGLERRWHLVRWQLFQREVHSNPWVSRRGVLLGLGDVLNGFVDVESLLVSSRDIETIREVSPSISFLFDVN